jgi:hypothetical protein
MLRISVIDSPGQRRLVLEGKLLAPWVEELKSAWKVANSDAEGRQLVIDMESVNLISQEGENALLELMEEGADFRCSGVLTRYVVQQLKRRSKKKNCG